MISIEAYPAQDGGSSFETNNISFNNIPCFMEELSRACSKDEKKATIRKAIKLMEERLSE